MQITVHLTADAAAGLRAAREDAHTAPEVLRTARELGIDLHPLDPAGVDPFLATTFMVEVEDVADAERVVSRLRGASGVESAYLKPPDALP
jgi:hypothetical protein